MSRTAESPFALPPAGVSDRTAISRAATAAARRTAGSDRRRYVATDEVLPGMIDLGFLPEFDGSWLLPSRDVHVWWPPIDGFDVMIPVPAADDFEASEPSSDTAEESTESDREQQAAEEATDGDDDDGDLQLSRTADSEDDEEQELIAGAGLPHETDEAAILEGMIRLEIEPADSSAAADEANKTAASEAVIDENSTERVELAAGDGEPQSPHRIEMDRARGHVQAFDVAALPAEEIPDFSLPSTAPAVSAPAPGSGSFFGENSEPLAETLTPKNVPDTLRFQ